MSDAASEYIQKISKVSKKDLLAGIKANEPISISDLALRYKMTLSGMSQRISKLKSQGYVKVIPKQNDHRIKYVYVVDESGQDTSKPNPDNKHLKQLVIDFSALFYRLITNSQKITNSSEVLELFSQDTRKFLTKLNSIPEKEKVWKSLENQIQERMGQFDE